MAVICTAAPCVLSVEVADVVVAQPLCRMAGCSQAPSDKAMLHILHTGCCCGLPPPLLLLWPPPSLTVAVASPPPLLACYNSRVCSVYNVLYVAVP